MSRISLGLTALALAIASAFPQSASAATLYSVLDLGSISALDDVTASGLNDLGQVVGESGNIEDGPVTFRTAPNRPINPASDRIDTDLITFSNDINNSGQVVGDTFFGRLSSGVRTDTNGLFAETLYPVVDANAINNLGQIAGRGLVAGCNSGCSEPERFNAVRVENSTNGTAQIIDLGTLGGGGSSGNGINDLGQVVGTSTTADRQDRAFRTAPNSVINPETDNLGTLGGSSYATDINNLGQVVGNSITANGQTHAFRTAANSAINSQTDDLGTLGGNFSQAEAINELGQVVGYSTLANGDAHAFLYEEGKMLDLNDLLVGNVGFTLTNAVGINEKGQIVANSSTFRVDEQGEIVPNFPGSDNQRNRAFLLTPVPEPASMLGVLAFGASASILRKKAKQKVKA